MERKLEMDYSKDKRFLNHLVNCIPESAYNYRLSSYTIILEAWRRGLSIDFQLNKDKEWTLIPNFYISNSEKTHRFNISTGDTVSPKALKTVKNKHLTKEALNRAGVSNPEGKLFEAEITNEEILNYSNEISYPVVVKPPVGFAGKGVIANIQDDDEMMSALKYVREKLNYKKVIVEKHFDGEDHRFYVVGDKVIGVIKRVPASIKGNGKDNIETLIKLKNEDRKKILSITDKPIKVNSETREQLKKFGFTTKSVPKKDEIVYLKSKSNISAGGEAVDVTDEISEEILQLAVDATQAIPTLVQAGVDIMVDHENNTGVILEINSRASIRSHVYPSYGKARDIPSAIIDHYFPETKSYNREEAKKLFIDYDFLFGSNLSRSASRIRLPEFPAHPIVLKRYVISGAEYKKNIATKIRRFAFNYRVNGYIKPLNNSNIVVIAGGNEEKVNLFYEQMKKHMTKVSKSAKIKEKTRTTPVSHGFEIIEDNFAPLETRNFSKDNLDKYSELKSEYQKLKKKLAEYEQKESVMEITKKQNIQLKKQLDHIEKSTSWKISKPIRLIGKIKKK